MNQSFLRRATAVLLLLGSCCLVPLLAGRPCHAAAEPLQQRRSEDSWQVIQLGGQRIGYAHSTVETVSRDGRKIIRTTNDTHISLRRGGQKLTMQVKLRTDETEDGQMLSFVQEVNNPPISATRTEGRVDGDKLKLTTTVGLQGKAGSTKTVDWDPSVKSPAWQERLLASEEFQPGQTRSFKMYSAELNKIVAVKLNARSYETITDFSGKKRKTLKVSVAMDIPGFPDVTQYLDGEGNAVKEEMSLFGLPMTVYAVSQEEALKQIAGEEFDLLVSTLVEVEPIPPGHRSRKVVYRITIPDDDPAEYFLSGPTQSIKRVSDDTIRLTVTSLPLPNSGKTVPTKPEYLADTNYLQCTNPAVVKLAEEAAGGAGDPPEAAARMEKYVYRKLAEKNFSTAMASAAEVAKSLEGDCTEHAVLLAAMLRAKKIPSRIAVGLVYVPRKSAFGGHMWTEAWLDGRWIPLDGTLGRGGIGAAHIKMVESSFSDDGPAPITSFLPMMQVLGKMKVDVISAE